MSVRRSARSRLRPTSCSRLSCRRPAPARSCAGCCETLQRTVHSVIRQRWRTRPWCRKSTAGPRRRPLRKRRPTRSNYVASRLPALRPWPGGGSLGAGLLEDSVERAEVEVGVAQLVEPVAQPVDIGLQPVDFAGVVLVRLRLPGDQLTTKADLFRNRPLYVLPLVGEIPQLAIERGQLGGQLLAGPAIARYGHHL